MPASTTATIHTTMYRIKDIRMRGATITPIASANFAPSVNRKKASSSIKMGQNVKISIKLQSIKASMLSQVHRAIHSRLQ